MRKLLFAGILAVCLFAVSWQKPNPNQFVVQFEDNNEPFALKLGANTYYPRNIYDVVSYCNANGYKCVAIAALDTKRNGYKSFSFTLIFE